MRWGTLSLPRSAWDGFTHSTSLIVFAIIIAYLLFFLSSIITAYVRNSRSMIQLSLQSSVVSFPSVMIASSVATGLDLDFYILMLFTIVPAVISGCYLIRFLDWIKPSKPVMQINIESSDLVNSRLWIKNNLELAIVCSYIYIVNTAVIIFFDKSILEAIDDSLPWSLKYIFEQTVMWIPLVMLAISLLLLIEKKTRKKILIICSLWFLCLIGIGIQMLKFLNHMHFA
jgi:hypothetical protein